MADSPPRSEAPGAAPGDDLTPPAAEGGAPGGFTTAPAPWGGSPPWWSSGQGDGTGPHAVPLAQDGTGPHRLPAEGTGPHRLPVNGTGPIPLPHGTGPLPVQHGTGPLPAQRGTGPLPAQRGTGPQRRPNGTGPVTAVAPPRPAGPPPRVPPAQGRKQASGLLLGAAIGAALGAMLLTGMFMFRTDEPATAAKAPKPGESTRRITAVPAAGGLHRDPVTAPPASAAYPFVAAAVRTGGIPAAKEGAAVYAEAPPGRLNVLFMGGTGAVGDPAAFLRRIRPSTFIGGQDAGAGPGGGRALCGTFAVLSDVHAYCAWATKDSYGIVATNAPAPERQIPVLADVTRRIRRDVERPKR